jgi:hypothetical protein
VFDVVESPAVSLGSVEVVAGSDASVESDDVADVSEVAEVSPDESLD